MEIFGYIALIAIGMVLALIGGGGSLLSVPILVYLFSFDVVTASSYSLFVVGTTSLVGAWLKQKHQRIDLKAAVIFSMCSVIAIFSTRKWIVPWLPDRIFIHDNIFIAKRLLILGVFALLAIVSSLTILLKNKTESKPPIKSRLKLLIPVSLATGTLAGFVGAGGGFLILPSLSYFARLPLNIALGTTLLIIGLNSLLGFVGDVLTHDINWIFLLLITSLATLGMLLGDFYCKNISIPRLRQLFGWITLGLAIAIIITELLH